MLVRREAETPTAADVMKDGKPLPGEGTTRVTEENLASGVDYTVYAAAQRGDLIGDVVSFGFTTGTSAYDDLLTLTDMGKNFISYHIEVEPETTFRHVALLKKVVENFTDGTQSEQEYAQRIQLLLDLRHDGHRSAGLHPARPGSAAQRPALRRDGGHVLSGDGLPNRCERQLCRRLSANRHPTPDPADNG
ncbi:MAG: hypothetical protein ACLS37_11150 [Alistipes sp.]